MLVEGSRSLSDMAARLGGLEQRVAELADALGEVKDLELVNKLDLLNLANQLEKLRMTAPGVAEAAQKGDELVRLEQAVAGMEADLSQLKAGSAPGSGLAEGKLAARVEELSRRLAALEGAEARPLPLSGDRCAACGTPGRSGARFCGKCGATMAPPHLAYAPAARAGQAALADAKGAGKPAKGLLHRRKR